MSIYRSRDQGPRGGAEHLARIHGTEEDKVNCPFYFKIGACRHGDKCSRQHHRPPFSETIIIKHMWNNPMITIVSTGGNLVSLDKGRLQAVLDDFYEEIFEEFKQYGKIEDIQVCENIGDHMVGNVYVKYYDEEDAGTAKQALHGRYYAMRPMAVEFSPVTDFREARCRQFDEGTCARGPYCNFMHVCEPSRELRRHLQKLYEFRGGRMKGTGGMDKMKDNPKMGNRDRGGDDRDRGRDGGRDSRDRRDRDRGDRDRGDRGDRDRGDRDRGDRDRGDRGDRDRGDRGDRDRGDRDRDRGGRESRDRGDRDRRGGGDRDRDRGGDRSERDRGGGRDRERSERSAGGEKVDYAI